MPKTEKGNNSVKILTESYEKLITDLIYIMHPNCMPDIMILAQAVLQIFCSHEGHLKST